MVVAPHRAQNRSSARDRSDLPEGGGRSVAVTRRQGAPIDNNIVERILKKAILHRKNALFYKTINGARVGDLFMSLIHIWELNGANPFNYLTELLRHPAALAGHPGAWMPWNYTTTLARIASLSAA
jgi:transposase